MRILIIIAILTISCKGYTQIYLDSLKKEDFVSDFNLSVNILKRNHPNPFKFINEREFDKKVDSLRIVLATKPNVFSFMEVIKDATNLVIDIEPNVTQQLFKRFSFFPYPVIIEKGRIFINIMNTEIPFGTEINEINGVPVLEILSDMVKNPLTDHISDFGIKLSFMNRGEKEYLISFTDTISLSKKTVKVDAVNVSTYFYRDNRKVYPFNIVETSHSTIYADFDQERNIGKITINTFDLNNVFAYQQFSDFFKEANKRKCKKVIIDIRNIEDGRPDIGAILFSFIAKESFYSVFNYRTNTIKFDFGEYGIDKNGEMLSEDYLKNENEFFFNNFSKDSSGRYIGKSLLMSGVSGNYPKDSDAFLGEINVLVGGNTGPVAIYFALLVQRNKRGIIIGNKTSDGVDVAETSGTGWMMGYRLPKTGFVINIPRSEIYFFDATVDNGRGLIPDVILPIERFLKNVKNGKDPEMTYALEN